MAEQAPKGLRLVEKTVEVLNLLAEERELTIAQLAERTGEPRSSLYRLLARLEQFELVEPASTRGYFRLGTHLLRWGAATQSGLSVRDRALPEMERLRDETGLTVYLVVRRGWNGVCIERIEGLRVASLLLQLGGSLPLHAGAAPGALLAFDDESQWTEYVNNHLKDSLSNGSGVDPVALMQRLRKTRESGISISDGDVTPGIASIGAPIYDHQNKVHAAISLSGLRESVLGENAARVEQLLRDAASTISRQLGASNY